MSETEAVKSIRPLAAHHCCSPRNDCKLIRRTQHTMTQSPGTRVLSCRQCYVTLLATNSTVTQPGSFTLSQPCALVQRWAGRVHPCFTLLGPPQWTDCGSCNAFHAEERSRSQLARTVTRARAALRPARARTAQSTRTLVTKEVAAVTSPQDLVRDSHMLCSVSSWLHSCHQTWHGVDECFDILFLSSTSICHLPYQDCLVA